MYYIGIDLGGTNIAVGLVSEDGKILRKAEPLPWPSVPTPTLCAIWPRASPSSWTRRS